MNNLQKLRLGAITKKLKRRMLKTVFLVAISVSPVFAGETLQLDLAGAREIALKNNPELKYAREDVLKAHSSVTGTRGNFLPSVSAFSQWQHAWELPIIIMDNPFNPSGGKLSFKMGTENNILYGLSFQQALFTGGANWSSYRISVLARDIALDQYKTKEQDILLKVTQSYYNVLFMESMVRVMQEGLNTASRNLAQVKKFYEAGKSSRFDVLRAEVQVANYRPMVVNAESNVIVAKSALRTVLGLPEDTEVEVTEELIYVPDSLLSLELDELISIAEMNRPEIMMIEKQKKIAREQLTLARSSHLPALIFGTNYQYQGQRDDMNFTENDFYKSFNSSISLSFPLFSGRKTSAQIQKAKAGIRQSRFQEQSLRAGIRMEIETAYSVAKQAEENVKAQEKIIEQAQEALRLAELMFAEGSSTQLDLMNSEFALDQAKMNYNKSLLEYHIAVASLKKAINQL